MKYMQFILFALVLVLAEVNGCFGQVVLEVPRNIQEAYQKGTRSESGRPGERYWQNQEDYDIRVNFDPATRKLSGTVAIDFTNCSPDTLYKVWFKLYPNLYQAEAPRTVHVSASDLTRGVEIKSMVVDGREVDSGSRVISGTNMVLTGGKIVPGQHVHYDISYQYQLNKGSFIRTGQIDSGAFFIAYFFPRLAVYDDIDGWNTYPYTGQYEFYNDFCHFKFAITVPGDYQVWATGDLKNPGEVYSGKFVERIRKAEQSDSVIDVITKEDLAAGHITRQSTANTWRFEADDVTDIAFGISNHYIWKSTSLEVDKASRRRTRIEAVFDPIHSTYFPIIGIARKTVAIISDQFPGIPYPYPHETVFDGPDEMEFPMMVDNRPFDTNIDAVELTAHEIFHTMFPFYVGTNETKYSFMDEGWATYTEFAFQRWLDPSLSGNYDLGDVNNSAGGEQDVPIMTLTPQLYGKARFSDKDLKPALGFLYIKEMLGEEQFDKAVRYFIREWAGKHPTPYDFFNCINDGAKTNLNWFWQNWFFEKNVPDLAIENYDSVKRIVTIRRVGLGMVPVHLSIRFSDGSSQVLRRSIACWEGGERRIYLSVPGDKTVKRLRLGDAFDADSNPANNELDVSN